MKIPVIWKSYNPDSPGKGYWDQGLIEDLLNSEIWSPVDGFEMAECSGFKEVSEHGGAIVVLPARSNTEYVDQLNEDLSTLKWAILMLTGDEENVFPLEKVNHKNIKIYVMSPRESLDLKKYRVLGTGYPPHMRKQVNGEDGATAKDIDYFFAGQITHGRRQEMKEQLDAIDSLESGLFGLGMYSEGFTQGLPPDDYYGRLLDSKVAPCPSGPETPDTFRLFEALEAGCIPIADTRVSKGGFSDNYWTFFFGEEPPFPIIRDYSDLRGYIEDQVAQFPAKNNRVFAWWQAKKRQMAYVLKQDISNLSGLSSDDKSPDNRITVVIPISPIPSHPFTDILDETIESIRHHLPKAEIILTFDGVREENESMRADYEGFIRSVLWKCNYVYHNVLPVIFDEHHHQTGMARAIIDEIQTPLMLYVEQDTPLVIDEKIDWNLVVGFLTEGHTDVVRFHHEAVIPDDHKHMMIEEKSIDYLDTLMQATCQWSQRPHVASVAFYRRILNTCFSPDAKSFIEDKMHGVCHSAFLSDGAMGWEQYRIHIYHPGGNIKRSYHTDGRGGMPKFDDTQVF